MIILNNMYTGRYISQQGHLGHEAINLVRADDGKFYIWLNSMGICTHDKVDNCSILMVRTINSSLYKVLAKAERCRLLPGAAISRKKHNAGTDDKIARANAQKSLGVTYNGKDPMDDIYHEQDMFATFVSDAVCEANGDIYLTNDPELNNPEQQIFYADFRISEAMRAYVSGKKGAYEDLKDFMQKDIWKAPAEQAAQFSAEIQETAFNFFKLLRKDKDELSFSNALAYFIQNGGIDPFLRHCLGLDAAFLEDTYTLLREKNNIDISFFGQRNVVIIENKIDAYITADKRTKLSTQISNAAKLYFSELSDEEKEQYTALLTEYATQRSGTPSQLSKYYLYALAYLMSSGMELSEAEGHIKCFLLIPEYSRKQFSQNENGGFVSDFHFSENYRVMTYKDIFEFYQERPVDSPYFQDFLSALVPLKKEFNNDLEEEMKIRFLRAVNAL